MNEHRHTFDVEQYNNFFSLNRFMALIRCYLYISLKINHPTTITTTKRK